MIAAALLHDVVEDTPATVPSISTVFGARVAQMVSDLTDVSVPSDGNRKVRKAIGRRHTAGASAEAKTIKLVDIIDNAGSVVEHDPEFARVYMAEKKALLEVLMAGDNRLFCEACDVVGNYYRDYE